MTEFLLKVAAWPALLITTADSGMARRALTRFSRTARSFSR
jgi:hypothetical protein